MSYETLVKHGILATMRISINAESLVFHATEMVCKDIVGFSYYTFSINTGTWYHINLIDSSGDELKIEFNMTQYMDDDPESVYGKIIEQCWKYFGQRILNETIRDISSGEDWEIGDVLLSQAGIIFKHKPWFGEEKTVLIRWEDTGFEVQESFLNLKSLADNRVSHSLHLGTYNVHVLAALIKAIDHKQDMLHYVNDTPLLHYLNGKKIFPS